MITMTLAEIADAVGGTVDAGDPGGLVRAGVTIDSRSVEPGGLFAALPGAHVDGHDFAGAAVEVGASAVLASRPVGVPAIVVPDVREALAHLASYVLKRLPDVTVLGVTGSQGKTTTKDLLAGVLADHAPTVATAGSFNNELGLPLTVLRVEERTRYLLLERGARGVGHIRDLCAIAPPDVALVLNVGKAHLGEFGDQETIALAKGELVEALPDDGVAVLNADDAAVSAMRERTRARVLTYGEADIADVRLTDLRLGADGRPSFTLRHGDAHASVRLQLLGEHQAHNAAAAATAAVALGVGLADVATSLEKITSASRWRMELRERSDGVTVINDAYNASPDSMRAALKTLAAIGRGRGPGTRTIAVLGEMRELGESSRDEHDAIGRLAVRLDIHQLLVVGEPARPMHLGAYLEGSWGEESVFVPDNDAATAWLRAHVRSGDVVLVKASRGARLDEVASALLDGEETGR